MVGAEVFVLNGPGQLSSFSGVLFRLWRESAKVVSRAKRGISTYQALSAEILPRFARQDTSLALSRQRLFNKLLLSSL
jgi:hypothetical protein